MGVPTFSLCYTTARPQLVQKVIKIWNDRSVLRQHDWIVSVDAGLPNDVMQALTELAKDCQNPDYRALGYTLVVNNGDKNCVAGWNAAASASSGKVIIAVSDDFLPPEGWDKSLLELKPDWIDGEYVVHVEDGFIHHLFTLAILTRKRYDRFGYLYYCGYESMFCDTEFGDVAHRDGVVIEAMHLTFEHLHPACGKRQRDDTDLNHENQVRWKRGETLYNFRKAKGFPTDVGPRAQPEKVNEKRQYCAYLQVTRDDLCLAEVCKRLHAEGVGDFFFSVPDAYWDGRPVVPSDIQEIKAAAEELRGLGLKVSVKVFKIVNYKFPGDTRIDTETRLRNDSLAWIRASGFEHILIVDGDELWMPGTLSIIDYGVSQGHLAISCYMIPVIGVPGYPVDKASDLAVVYIGGQCQFKGCRTPFIQQTIIPRAQIIHFTGTRRTLEETIAKHRTSGHYDDKDYDFETWIKDILPNIKPGFTYRWPSGITGVHMYLKYNPWPSVRDWRPEEWAQVPEPVKKYLGQPQAASVPN
jgi:hypothetical protein